MKTAVSSSWFRQARSTEKLYQRNIRTGDRAVDRNVFAKVTVSDNSTRLCLGLRNISRIYRAAFIGITSEHSHAHRGVRQNLRKTIHYSAQSHCDELGVAHSGKVHSHGVAGKNRAAGNAT